MTKKDKTLILAFGLGLAALVAVTVVLVTIIAVFYSRDKELVAGNIHVKYHKNVATQDAQKFADWMRDDFAKAKSPEPLYVKLSKVGTTYEVRVMLKKGLESDPDQARAMKFMATVLSKEVFGGAPCDLVGCDEKWNDLRVYPGAAR